MSGIEPNKGSSWHLIWDAMAARREGEIWRLVLERSAYQESKSAKVAMPLMAVCSAGFVMIEANKRGRDEIVSLAVTAGHGATFRHISAPPE